jgi:hypothetical protein
MNLPLSRISLPSKGKANHNQSSSSEATWATELGILNRLEDKVKEGPLQQRLCTKYPKCQFLQEQQLSDRLKLVKVKKMPVLESNHLLLNHNSSLKKQNKKEHLNSRKVIFSKLIFKNSWT